VSGLSRSAVVFRVCGGQLCCQGDHFVGRIELGAMPAAWQYDQPAAGNQVVQPLRCFHRHQPVAPTMKYGGRAGYVGELRYGCDFRQ